MAYRNKTYVAFDATNDIHYYRLMTAWKQNDYSSFSFFDAHDINNIMSFSSEDTIKIRLRERLKNTREFILLIGDKTKYHHKFVKWEIEQAIKLDIPIICVNLNNIRWFDAERCPFILKDILALHISFNSSILQYALEHWEENHKKLKREGQSGPCYIEPAIYKNLGL
jgi:hypothetical protein